MLTIGLVSLASNEGLSAVLLDSDGEDVLNLVAEHEAVFTPLLQDLIGQAREVAARIGSPVPDPVVDEAAHVLMQLYVEAVRAVRFRAGLEAGAIEAIGFLGAPLLHKPDSFGDWRAGNPQLLANGAGISVVTGFNVGDGTAVDAQAIAVAAAQRAMMFPVQIPGLDSSIADQSRITLYRPTGL